MRGEARQMWAVLPTVPTHRNTQGILDSGNVLNPVVSGEGSQFFVQNSFSVSPSKVLNLQSVGHVHYSLGTGASGDDALYDENVKDVVCTIRHLVTRGLAMRGWIGRRGDRAIRPLGGL